MVARGLTKRYGQLTVLDGVDLEIGHGEFVVLVGPSGSGKSTVLHLIAALEPADGGELIVAGQALHRHARGMSRFRRREIGIVFQLHNLIPRLTARENVEAAMFGTHRGHRERTDRATELLERLDLADRADERPTTMSGGERQRVAVARALANEPKVLLADEPTGSLDTASADIVLEIFAELIAGGTTILAVSHDARLNAHANRLVPIVAGKTEPAAP
ncbi:MAG: ABC transporter ATP-binding protein [Acidimicrobiia bacterium]|nr:ABC transporter ATP-binding protein [Acidimicrobiia bacterium]